MIARFPKSLHRMANIAAQYSSTTTNTPTLPRLPVPNLRKTLDKYLQSLKPLLLEDEARGGAPFESAFQARVLLANDFENTTGKLCQERLLALDRKSQHNWLDDNFWMKKAYHEWRAPLPINSNWWLAFQNDNTIPREVLHGLVKESPSGTSPWQIRRAAWLIHRILDFKERLNEQELYPETTRTGIWLRDSTSKMFNVGRIPQRDCDALSEPPSPSHPDSNKVLVMVHDWCYTITVYNGQSRLAVQEIENRLQAVVSDAESRLIAGERAVPVGILSADDRDRWAKNLHHLLSLSPINFQNHQLILNSIMGLSLDHSPYSTSTLKTNPPASAPRKSQLWPDSPAEVDAHLHNIRSSSNGRNRWYDKAVTLIVDANTRAGMMGEHSPCDALVPSIVAEYALVQGIEGDAFEHSNPVAQAQVCDSAVATGWERLDWVVDEHITRECGEAEGRAKALIDDSDDSILWFTDYGADWIKEIAKLSPDAYIQLALQLAWYKQRGEFTATYETALTRMFDRGRTETIRSLTVDSRAFVLGMVNPVVSVHERRQLLLHAIQTHSSLTRDASTGRGIDRHLLGLKIMLRPEQDGACEFFEDEIFQRSQQWKLSTSGLSAGHLFRGTGFGAAYQDGYGINYLAGPDIIKFGIESKHSSSLTSTSGFKARVIEALIHMKAVFYRASSASFPNHL